MQNNKVRFTSIGDVGVDIYPDFQKKLPGGTALNSAIFASQVGAEASVISAVGNDEISQIPREAFKKWEINTRYLEIIEGETDRVDIKLDPEGRPEYENWELGTLKEFRLTQKHHDFLETQHVAIAVHLPEIKPLFDGFAKMDLKKAIKVADFTDLSEYKGDVSIINKYINQFDIIALSIDAQEKDRLADYYDIAQENKKMAIALMGKDGSAVYTEGNLFYQEALKVKVTDTTGAGDVYLATFLVQYLQTQDIAFSMKQATKNASEVIQYVGAIKS